MSVNFGKVSYQTKKKRNEGWLTHREQKQKNPYQLDRLGIEKKVKEGSVREGGMEYK